ncbi:hypothetical protein HYW17_01780 [Candidatus Uhrbacteria bacterium]|nr:hypothetical protein [Candidatus Uhrbacteria bacterium]
MSQQQRRDVLFMDVHGVFLTLEGKQEREIALAGKQQWVWMIRTALAQAGALPPQIKEALLDPYGFWDLRMRLELSTSKIEGGKVVTEKKFQERVNLRLLRKVAPAFVNSLDLGGRRRLARQVRKLRRDAPRPPYILTPQMRELVQWLVDEDGRWMLCLTTARSSEFAQQLLREQNAPMNLFVRVFISEQVGPPKSHPDFWIAIAKKLQSAVDRCVVLENNLVMGMTALQAGMSVIFIDRDDAIEEFISRELGGALAGITLSSVGESLPMDGTQFVVCAKSPAGIKLCLERIKGSPRGGT